MTALTEHQRDMVRTLANESRVQQRKMALTLANQTRRERYVLKRRIAAGDSLTAAAVLVDCPPDARPGTWLISDLLAAQRRWSVERAERLLRDAGVPESKTVGELTARQRAAIAGALGHRQAQR
jgi:hypothetical protein